MTLSWSGYHASAPRNKSDKSSITDSARRGSFHIKRQRGIQTVKQKCGRIRACNACKRASPNAGEKARVAAQNTVAGKILKQQ
jgi:hypothetical protein